jgi:hypothetical protein
MSIKDEFNRFDCECGATIYFKKVTYVVKEWAKYHKPHMKKYLNVLRKGGKNVVL